MSGVEARPDTLADERIDACLRQLRDELAFDEHREDLPVHLVTVGRIIRPAVTARSFRKASATFRNAGSTPTAPAVSAPDLVLILGINHESSSGHFAS